MKKIIFLSLAILIFLTGCGKKMNPVFLQSDQIPESNKPFERFLPRDTGYYEQPTIITKEGTGLVVALLNADPNAPYDWVEVEENGEKIKVATVTGYIYSYTYNDLGIKITTSPLYYPYFFEKTEESILQRYKNMIYFSKDIRFGGEYIEMFKKDPSESLQTIIEKKHLGTGCIAYNRMDNGYDFTKDNRFKTHGRRGVDINNFFDITGPDGSLGSDIECHPDNEYLDSYGPIFFVQSKSHKDRYYKISMGDACAPGPCSIFGDIEFF